VAAKKAEKVNPRAKRKNKTNDEVEISTTYRSNSANETSLLDVSLKSEQDQSADIQKERHGKYFLPVTVLVTALMSALITLGITQQISPTLPDRTTLAAKTNGGVCLTENELRTLIQENNIQAYWTGPIKDATYSVNSSTPGQVFIRYVPSGEKCDDLSSNFRVIATYTEANAFATTEAAGATADGVSLINTDGSIVYFNKNLPSNIYVAYPGIEYQIEVYDPVPKEALILATTQGKLQMIKG
jgi:hypothetical protein